MLGGNRLFPGQRDAINVTMPCRWTRVRVCGSAVHNATGAGRRRRAASQRDSAAGKDVFCPTTYKTHLVQGVCIKQATSCSMPASTSGEGGNARRERRWPTGGQRQQTVLAASPGPREFRVHDRLEFDLRKNHSSPPLETCPIRHNSGVHSGGSRELEPATHKSTDAQLTTGESIEPLSCLPSWRANAERA